MSSMVTRGRRVPEHIIAAERGTSSRVHAILEQHAPRHAMLAAASPQPTGRSPRTQSSPSKQRRSSGHQTHQHHPHHHHQQQQQQQHPHHLQDGEFHEVVDEDELEIRDGGEEEGNDEGRARMEIATQRSQPLQVAQQQHVLADQDDEDDELDVGRNEPTSNGLMTSVDSLLTGSGAHSSSSTSGIITGASGAAVAIMIPATASRKPFLPNTTPLAARQRTNHQHAAYECTYPNCNFATGNRRQINQHVAQHQREALEAAMAAEEDEDDGGGVGGGGGGVGGSSGEAVSAQRGVSAAEEGPGNPDDEDDGGDGNDDDDAELAGGDTENVEAPGGRVLRSGAGARIRRQSNKDVLPYPCKFEGCQWSGRTASARTMHSKRTHKSVAQVNKDHYCQLCGASVSGSVELSNHIERAHVTQLLRVEETFPTEEAYQEWLINIRNRYAVDFVAYRGAKRNSDGSTYRLLNCSLSGKKSSNWQPEKPVDDRPANSRKCGHLCPAHLSVVVRSGGAVHVIGCLSHLAHALDDTVAPLALHHQLAPRNGQNGDDDEEDWEQQSQQQQQQQQPQPQHQHPANHHHRHHQHEGQEEEEDDEEEEAVEEEVAAADDDDASTQHFEHDHHN